MDIPTTAIFAAILGAQAPATAAEQGGDSLILLARFTDGSVMTTWQDDAGGAFRKTWSYLSS